MHGIALHNNNILDIALPSFTSHFTASPYLVLPYATLHHNTLDHISVHHVTSHYYACPYLSCHGHTWHHNDIPNMFHNALPSLTITYLIRSYITLSDMTLHCNISRCLTITDTTIQCNTTTYNALRCITLRQLASHHTALHQLVLRCIAMPTHYITTSTTHYVAPPHCGSRSISSNDITRTHACYTTTTPVFTGPTYNYAQCQN